MTIEEVDVASATATGYLSGTVNPGGDNLEGLLAVDAEGRAWFNIDGGVRQVSLSQPLIPNPSGSSFGSANCPSLNTSAPLKTPQQIQELQPVAGVSLYVGGQPATVTNGGTEVDLPASATVGPADVECIDTQGNAAVSAQDVSYGMDLVALSANLLPPGGNSTAYIFGFGFAPQNASTAPAVSFNGTAAPKVALLQNPGTGVLQGAALQIPSGTAGQSVEVGISSSLGTGTLAAAAAYYPTPTLVPASGILQLTFDTQRNLLYALKPSGVDVLDATTLQWGTPLAFPATSPKRSNPWPSRRTRRNWLSWLWPVPIRR